MLVFLDVFSGDELGGDAFPLKEDDDIAIEMEGKLIKISTDVDVADDTGAGQTDEDAADDAGESVTKVNIVHAHELEQTQFTKKSYQVYIKGYTKRLLTYLKEHNPERAAIFEKKAPAFIKGILANFNDWDFYTGKSMDPDAGLAMLNYRDDGQTPYVVVLKDSVKQEQY
ncbi:translationally-controlled tumor protein [Streptomyces morookaense]|uniref:translationally-controlled tumor protein n=1 Tax=Streptomyces morookaense TaxID=1970 RepID=UPI0033EBFB7E